MHAPHNGHLSAPIVIRRTDQRDWHPRRVQRRRPPFREYASLIGLGLLVAFCFVAMCVGAFVIGGWVGSVIRGAMGL